MTKINVDDIVTVLSEMEGKLKRRSISRTTETHYTNEMIGIEDKTIQ